MINYFPGEDAIVEALVEKRRRQKEKDAAMSASKKAAIGGAASGFVGGGLSSLMGGAKSLPKILSSGAITGAATGGITGVGTYLGSKMLGAPSADDGQAYANRSGLGAAVTGGALGAGLGTLLGSKRMSSLVAGIPKVSSVLEQPGFFNNYLTDIVKKRLVGKGVLQGASAAALGGSLIGGLLGTDEGMAVDYLNGLDRHKNVGI